MELVVAVDGVGPLALAAAACFSSASRPPLPPVGAAAAAAAACAGACAGAPAALGAAGGEETPGARAGVGLDGCGLKM